MPELWTSSAGFNETNVQDLFNKINGASGTTLAQIKELANSKMTASQIRAKTYGKTSSQDIEVVLGGLEWEVVYLSTDTDGNAILTLWLDNNQQPGWTGKSQTEGAFYGFYDGGLYSDWSADWNNASFTSQTYPSNMYGTSYIRAVTLNNGGGYVATSGASSLTTVSQNTNSVFAPFTMSSSGLYEYIVSPNKVSWQLDQTARGSDYAKMTYDLPNDSLNNPTGAKWYTSSSNGSSNMTAKTNYKDWGNDKLWLPSMAETGYDTSYDGMWNLSVDQRKNYNGSTDSISGQKVGSSNTPNVSSLYTYSWLRSGNYSSASYAYPLYPHGSAYSDRLVNNSFAVRPALHLNLTSIAENIWGWLLHTSGKDFANSGHQGTEGDPYEISSAEDLAQLAKSTNTETSYDGCFFKLTTDIDLNAHLWTPIGIGNNYFAGNFDGDNHTIRGMQIKDSSGGIYQSVGLFGSIETSSCRPEIKNINLIESSIYSDVSSRQVYGVLVGEMFSLSDSDISFDISNCHVDATVSLNKASSFGGILGESSYGSYSNRASITNCSFSGSVMITGEINNVGGVAGSCSYTNASINSCHSSCSIYAPSATYVGGIAGTIQLCGIENCISDCYVYGGSNYTGGICGNFGSSDGIKNCVVKGRLDAFNQNGLAAIFGTSGGLDVVVENNCFVGSSPKTDLKFCAQELTEYDRLASSFICCGNNKVYTKSGDFKDWAIVKNFNGGLPVQKSLFAIGIDDGTDVLDYLANTLHFTKSTQ